MYYIEELIKEFGNDFLLGTRRADDALYPVEDMDAYLPEDPKEAFMLGWRSRNQFIPSDSYFTFDGYGNIISIPSREYISYLQDQIDEDEFVDWLLSNGYINEDEDYEDED
jgi:hypothetical protein